MWFKVNNRLRPNDINQYNPNSPVITKANSAYEMMGNEGQQITFGNNYAIGDTTDDAHMSPIYDNPDWPEESPPPTPPRLYENVIIS